MRRLLRREEAPPQDGDGFSFRYVFPEDAFVARASDYNTWKDNIREHAIGNGLAIPDMAVCEDQLCGTLPPDRCKYETGDAPPQDIEFTYTDVANWMKAILAKFAAGAGFVEQAEAERRAEICVRCPLNTSSRGCSSCAKLAEMLTPGMRGKHTLQDSKLKNCGICKCYNRIQVHFPLDFLRENDTSHAAYPNFCWKA